MVTNKSLQESITRMLNFKYPAGVVCHYVSEEGPYVTLLEVKSEQTYATYQVFLELLEKMNIVDGMTVWDRDVLRSLAKYRLSLHVSGVRIKLEPEAIAGCGFRVIHVDERVYYVGTVKEMGRHKRLYPNNRFIAIADITDYIPPLVLMRINLKESHHWIEADGYSELKVSNHIAIVRFKPESDQQQTIEISIKEKRKSYLEQVLYSRCTYPLGEVPILNAKLICQMFLSQQQNI